MHIICEPNSFNPFSDLRITKKINHVRNKRHKDLKTSHDPSFQLPQPLLTS